MAELKDKLVTLEDLKEAYDNTVHLDSDYVTGVKGNVESTYRHGDVNLSPTNIGAKAVQSTVNDPTAAGTSITFISNISQNTQGVISPTKKTVASASQSASGLMSSADKRKLDGLTASSIGALPTSGGTMTGSIDMGQNSAGVAGNVVKWTASDGAEFSVRPYGADLQVVRKPSGGSSVGILTFKSDGTIVVSSAANWRTALGAAAASNVSDLIIKRSFTLTTSVSLNSLASSTYEVPYTTPTGYKAVAALEGRVDGGIFAVTVNLRANGTHCAAYVINAGSGTRTGTGVTVDILFIRDI